MAVVVSDTRTIFNEGDSLTGWNIGEVVTTGFAESTGWIANATNIETTQIYYTAGTSIDATDTLMYVYSFNNALQNNWDNADPPNGLHIGDGTNRVSFNMAGGDKDVFKHPSGPVAWQSLVLDGSQAASMDTAGLTVARAGTFASLNLQAITQIGGDYTTTSKALGGGYNTGVDIIRYGNNGLTVVGGTTGDRGTFAQIATEDRSTANQKAHGLIRELITGVFGVQGPLTFGGASTVSWFQDSGKVVSFEDRNINDNKYFLNVDGGTGETHFLISGSTITTAGPFVSCDFSSANIDELSITTCSFTGLGNAITFSEDVSASDHTVTNNSFDGCGLITPGIVEFRNNTIANSTSAATGAMLLSDTTKMSGLSFNSGGTGHAILIEATDTYSITDFTFTGYGANDTSDAAIFNNSGGAVTLQVSGTSGLTVRNGPGASTTIENTQTFEVTGLVSGSEVRVYNASDGTEIDGVENSGTTFSFTYNYTVDIPVNVYIHHVNYQWLGINSVLDSNGVSIPVQQRFDRNYSNP